MIAPGQDNVERLKTALRSLWDDPCVDEIDAAELAGDYPAVRYVPPDGDLYLDIVTRFGRAISFRDIEAERITMGEVEVNVATPRTLFRMKKGTVRPLDHADARALQRRFGPEDED